MGSAQVCCAGKKKKDWCVFLVLLRVINNNSVELLSINSIIIELLTTKRKVKPFISNISDRLVGT